MVIISEAFKYLGILFRSEQFGSGVTGVGPVCGAEAGTWFVVEALCLLVFYIPVLNYVVGSDQENKVVSTGGGNDVPLQGYWAYSWR